MRVKGGRWTLSLWIREGPELDYGEKRGVD